MNFFYKAIFLILFLRKAQNKAQIPNQTKNVNRKILESYNLRNERLLSLTLSLETKSHSLSMTMSDLTSTAGKHFTFNVLSDLYFVNHLLFVFINDIHLLPFHVIDALFNV